MNLDSKHNDLIKEYTNLVKLTKHQKDLELAAAGATKCGINIQAGDATEIAEAIDSIGTTLLALLSADAAETTKRDALAILRTAAPSVNNMNISGVSIDMRVQSNG